MRAGKRTLVELHAVTQRLQVRHMRAQSELSQRARSPGAVLENAHDFQDFLRHIHGVVFGELLTCGDFRQPGEPCIFDVGCHERQGAPPEEIAPRLAELHGRLIAGTAWGDLDAAALAERCATFLVGFFAIHPFLDGNGRVGRLLLAFLVEAGGRFMLQPWPKEGRFRRKYLWALRYAHRRRAERVHDPRSGPNPYRGMARLILGLLIAREEEVLEPPVWLTD